MKGNLLYSDRGAIAFDLDGFTPSVVNPHYDETLKILLDPPDLSEKFDQVKTVQVKVDQDFSRRINQMIINSQLRTNKAANFTHEDSKLNQLLLDYERPEYLGSYIWDFSGNVGDNVTNDVFNPLVIDKSGWRYTTRSLKYTDTEFHSYPTSIYGNYVFNQNPQISIHIDEDSDSWEVEWWVNKDSTFNRAKVLLYSSTDFTTPIVEVYWLGSGSGRDLNFQGVLYSSAYSLSTFQKYKLECNVSAKTVNLYIDDVLLATQPMMNFGITDGITRLFSIWLHYASSLFYFDDVSYTGSRIAMNHVRLSGNPINLVETVSLNLKRLWDMSVRDFEITENITGGSNYCLIKHGNHNKTFQGHERLYILTEDKLIGKEILSMSEEDSETERIVLKTTFDDAIPVDEIKRSGYARLCRIDDDEIEFEFVTSNHYVSTIGLTELSAEEYGDFT